MALSVEWFGRGGAPAEHYRQSEIDFGDEPGKNGPVPARRHVARRYVDLRFEHPPGSRNPDGSRVAKVVPLEAACRNSITIRKLPSQSSRATIGEPPLPGDLACGNLQCAQYVVHVFAVIYLGMTIVIVPTRRPETAINRCDLPPWHLADHRVCSVARLRQVVANTH